MESRYGNRSVFERWITSITHPLFAKHTAPKETGTGWRTVLLMILLCGIFSAQATDYVYDTEGRLVAVTNDAGQSARYVYDAMGNIVRINHLSTGTLAVFGFAPARGAVGTPVRIQGQGFSDTASANTVKFNGAIASVVSATATELQVQVPVGASSGPITVTVGSITISSETAFEVDAALAPPVITSVQPLIAAEGQTLTVDGSNFL